MQLQNLIEALGLAVTAGDANVNITDVTDDSRRAATGSLFIARGGAASGDGQPDYTAQAIERGCAAVVSEHAPPATLPQHIAWVQADRVDQPLAGRIAEQFFGEPSKRITLVGITGTNGKTTTAFLIQHLLQQTGVKCGLIGTVFIDDGGERRAADLTTPGAIDVSRLLANMVRNGCRAAVAEVSSHALEQGRTAALRFDVGVFTNLTGDHLDYHGTMEAYAAAKAKLFEQLDARAWAVVNHDDAFGRRMVERCGARVAWCSMLEEDLPPGSCRATPLAMHADHSLARFDGPWGSVEVRLPLVGRHNVFNAMQAMTAANAVTSIARTVRTAIESSPPVPGRLEPVTSIADDERSRDASTLAQPVVLVDYAHTHDALENVLLALRPVVKGRLVVVFGCGGDRDRTKRPKMAAVACKLADRVVITSDNPRTEDPVAIIREIQTGVPPHAAEKVTVEVDRARAIAQAIADAGADDTVLLAGKGHEDYQIIRADDGGTVKVHFDDREHAEAALQARAAARAVAGRAKTGNIPGPARRT